MDVVLIGSAQPPWRDVVERFLARGDAVRALLPLTDHEIVPHRTRVDVVVGDGQEATVRAAAEHADLVCDLGLRFGAPDFSGLFSCSLVGAPHLVAAYESAHVRRVVLVSSVAVYRPAPRKSRWPIDEGSPLEAHGDPDLHAYGLANIAAEAALGASWLNHVTLRTSSVYGAGVDWATDLVAQCLRNRRRHTSRREGPPMQWTHARDLADGIVLAATRATARGAVYNIAGGELFTHDDIVQAVRSGGSPPVSRTEKLKYDLAKARNELAFIPAVGLRPGLMEIVRSLERRGEPAAA